MQGNDVGEILRRVTNGDLSAPRTINSDIPKPLEAVCLRAMAASHTNRYASPQELADDVERFLAHEPVSAFAEPLLVKTRRWVRKHQTLTVAAVAAVLIAGLGLFAIVVSGKNAELAELNERERDARRRAEHNENRAADAQELAESSEATAREQTQLTLDALNTLIFDIQRRLKNVPRGGEARRQLLNTALTRLRHTCYPPRRR